MDENRGDNVFRLFGEQNSAVRHLQTVNDADRPDYYACGISLDEGKGNEEWFRVHSAQGAIEMCRYVDILKVYAPVHQLLTIICETCIFELEGRHLDVIPLLIQDRTLRALYLFEPELDSEPPDETSIITRITRKPLLVEDE